MRKILFFILTLTLASKSYSQTDSMISRIPADTSKLKMNMDAVYNRPFLQMGKMPVSLGGYVEANSSFFGTDGVNEGLSFQIPRMTVFISSTIKNRIKFLSEIEFEEGGKEIAIEFASMDMEFHPLLNLRGGIIMNPIGSFNQNHDGPKWEFIDRPFSATTIIPSTWSNVGFGIFGKYASNNWVWAYEAYLTNGFDNKIIDNDLNRTWLPASKESSERFEESFNGYPLTTIKTAIRHRRIAEVGLSWMGGVYNKFMEEGVEMAPKRRVDVYALDFNSTLPKINTYINGEFVWAFVDLPDSYLKQFGSKQKGGFIDIVQPVMKRKIFSWENSVLNLAMRLEYADYNVGTFTETSANIGDNIFSLVPGISFRPSPQSVIRLNYRYLLETDLLDNPPAITSGLQFGFSTYF